MERNVSAAVQQRLYAQPVCIFVCGCLLSWLYTYDAWLMHAACMFAACAVQRHEAWTSRWNSDVSRSLMNE